MPRDGYNERKLKILNYIDSVGAASRREISEEMGITDGAVGNLLRRYRLNGLLKRDKIKNEREGRNPYMYFLSENGEFLLKSGKIEAKKRTVE